MSARLDKRFGVANVAGKGAVEALTVAALASISACATLPEAAHFKAPGVIDLKLGEGSEITSDCHIDSYTQRIIDHQRGQILGCIRYPLGADEDHDFHWAEYYCDQPANQGWTAVNTDRVGMCVYRRPTATEGCFESLSFEYGMAEREIDAPDFWKAPALHTFAVVLSREYCPAARRAS